MYKLFLTFRYLTRRPLSLVAIFVLMIAIAVLVVAPSVMAGFQEEFHKRLRGALSDVTVWGSKPFSMSDDPTTEAYLASLPHVEAVAPYVENPALDKHVNKIDYCFLRGIDPYKEAEVSKFRDYFLSDRQRFLQLERPELKPDDEAAAINEAAELLDDTVDLERIYKELSEGSELEPDMPTIAVGIYYLKRWELEVGDVVRLTTASDEGEVNEDQKFLIVAAFATGRHEFDRRLIVMSMKSIQELVKIPGKVSGYSLRLSDYKLASETKAQLAADIRGGTSPLPRVGGYFLKTWEERNENLLKAVLMEKLLIRLMTYLIVAAASASIFLVLFMTVHSKTRELGILRAVGATRLGVFSLFVGQGFLLAFVGMVLGLGLGYLFGTYINEIADLLHKTTGWHPFPPEVYYLDRIPMKFGLKDTLVNFSVTLILGASAAFWPAILAAFRPPLRSIRYE
jgi:lipoprotein-releasing system permease protein